MATGKKDCSVLCNWGVRLAWTCNILNPILLRWTIKIQRALVLEALSVEPVEVRQLTNTSNRSDLLCTARVPRVDRSSLLGLSSGIIDMIVPSISPSAVSRQNHAHRLQGKKRAEDPQR